jgi:integrase
MVRPLHKLTARTVASLSVQGVYSDGAGLYLRVTGAGTKAWVYRWRAAGRLRDHGLGSVRDVSLADARERAAACRKQVAAGLDPIAEARKVVAQTKRVTFAECADALIEAKASAWRNEKHRWQWAQTLGDSYCGAIRSKPVEAIELEDVLDILKPIWQSKPETAKRLRGRLEKVLDFARVKGWRSGDNPARWAGHLAAILPAPQRLSRGHHAAMPYGDVPAFMVALSERTGVAAACLRFTILSAARTGEAIGAKWSEIDFEAKAWRVPASRMKAGKEHVVPLSDAAIAILDTLRAAGGEYIFAGPRGRPLSNMGMNMLLRDMGAAVTVHGFRSSFRDWTGDKTSFPREIAEAALAHSVGNEVERSYRRGTALDQRRELMAAWSNHCAGRSAEVVRLRAPA